MEKCREIDRKGGIRKRNYKKVERFSKWGRKGKKE